MITIAKNGERFVERYDDIIPLEKPNIIKQYESLLQEDYYIVDSFLKKYNLTLKFLNKILNFNLISKNDNNIFYINRKLNSI